MITSKLRGIVPGAQSTIAEALAGLLDDLPVNAREFGLTLNEGITAQEVHEVFSRIDRTEDEVKVRLRFKVGDAWNQLHLPAFQVVRLNWLTDLRSQMSEDMYVRRLRLFRKYGWVANKWPEERRKYPPGWTFYVVNQPGQPIKATTPEAPTRLISTRPTWIDLDGDEYVEATDANGRTYLVQILMEHCGPPQIVEVPPIDDEDW